MKLFICILTLIIISCNNQHPTTNDAVSLSPEQIVISVDAKSKSDKQICWMGALNNKTPIFIQYQLVNNLVIGEITYMNTRDKQPIKLIGTVEENKIYRLFEFDETGNITGIIEGTPTQKIFNGSWFSPSTKKELEMNLLPKDTLIYSASIMPEPNLVFGDYHYQYGKNGYNGHFKFNDAGGGKAAFNIVSLTNIERGPNIAEVEQDTIDLSDNYFVYTIPDSDDCEFKVTFYKSFAYINYTRGDCENEFGLNATIEGIYLKTQ